MVVGKLNGHMQKNVTRQLSYTIYQNNLKMDKRLKCKTKAINLLKENTGSKILDISQ